MPRTRLRLVAAAVAVLVLLGTAGALALWLKNGGSSDEPGGLVSFHADPGGNSGLYVTSADGSGVRIVSDSLAGHPFSRWSPDGRRLAFLAGAYGEGELLVIGLEGRGEHRVGRHLVRGFDWSPDGRMLAYESTIAGIWVAEAAGKGRPRQLARSGAGPVWSPDGRWVAYFAGVGRRLDVFAIRARGGRPLRLTNHPAPDHSPQWSPDGSRLALISERDGNTELYLIRRDGSRIRRLTDDPAPDEAFGWAPDGGRLVYVSYRDGADPLSLGIGNAEIFTVDVRSGRTQNLSNEPGAWDGDPAWSPDGRWIVFTRRTDHGELALMRADGSGQRLLPGAVDEEFNDCCAAWQPP